MSILSKIFRKCPNIFHIMFP
ncbi:hypothetical protein MXB_2323 [Myxobolus squamalis]|nr:hypothetical protein MXB_2323 [Myxobolus squamalis]